MTAGIKRQRGDAPTPRQREILQLIAQRIAQDQAPPTLREIGEQLGLRNPSAVAGHLLALAEKGYLDHEAISSRGIRLVGARLSFEFTDDDDGWRLAEALSPLHD